MSTLLKVSVLVRAQPEDLGDLRTIISAALNYHGYTEHAVSPGKGTTTDAPDADFTFGEDS